MYGSLGWRHGLHPRAEARLERAAAALATGRAATVIVSGGAVHSEDNEAVLMRQWLLAHSFHYFVDDAYIFLRYARSAATGHGLVYNFG